MRRALTTTAALIRCCAAGITLALCTVGAPADAQERSAEIKTEPQGFIREPDAVHRAALFGNRHFGAGWIAGGPGYRSWYRKDSLFVDASAAMSWRGYRTAQARFELPKLVRSRLAIGSQFKWQDAKQIDAYGEGPDTLESNRAQYRLRSSNLVGYATLRPLRWLGIGTHVGWLKPSVHAPSGSFRSDRPDVRD